MYDVTINVFLTYIANVHDVEMVLYENKSAVGVIPLLSFRGSWRCTLHENCCRPKCDRPLFTVIVWPKMQQIFYQVFHETFVDLIWR